MKDQVMTARIAVLAATLFGAVALFGCAQKTGTTSDVETKVRDNQETMADRKSISMAFNVVTRPKSGKYDPAGVVVESRDDTTVERYPIVRTEGGGGSPTSQPDDDDQGDGGSRDGGGGVVNLPNMIAGRTVTVNLPEGAQNINFRDVSIVNTDGGATSTTPSKASEVSPAVETRSDSRFRVDPSLAIDLGVAFAPGGIIDQAQQATAARGDATPGLTTSQQAELQSLLQGATLTPKALETILPVILELLAQQTNAAGGAPAIPTGPVSPAAFRPDEITRDRSRLVHIRTNPQELRRSYAPLPDQFSGFRGELVRIRTNRGDRTVGDAD